MPEKTLLEKAKEIKMSMKYHQSSQEDKELVWAWANEEVSFTAITKLLFPGKLHGNNAYCYITRVFKHMVRDKDIILSSKSKKNLLGGDFPLGDFLDKKNLQAFSPPNLPGWETVASP
jgi:hypothetical protein